MLRMKTVLLLSLLCLTRNAIPQSMTGNDGKRYPVVKIGDQVWMASNLRETVYRDGSEIQNIGDPATWAWLVSGARCAYEGNESNAEIYGYLYNWYAVSDGRNIAPPGWHVPADSEWQVLVDTLGGSGEAGGKLKEAGFEHWSSPNSGASNESRFCALPGGRREDILDRLGGYRDLTKTAHFWSADESDNYYAWSRYLSYDMPTISRRGYDRQYGFSVRLIKDDSNLPVDTSKVTRSDFLMFNDFRLEPPSPNPFNPVTRIQIDLAVDAQIFLHVTDIRGRHVRTLFTGLLKRGTYDYDWDGRDDTNNCMPGGCYLTLLETRHGIRVQKAILLR